MEEKRANTMLLVLAIVLVLVSIIGTSIIMTVINTTPTGAPSPTANTNGQVSLEVVSPPEPKTNVLGATGFVSLTVTE